MNSYEHLPTGYTVGGIAIKTNIILAPMVGVTDSVFRRMILGLGGCGLVSSEMTNAARRERGVEDEPRATPALPGGRVTGGAGALRVSNVESWTSFPSC